MRAKGLTLAIIVVAAFSFAIPSISFSKQVSNSDASSEAVSDEDAVDIHNGYRVKGRLPNRVRLGNGRYASSTSSFYFTLGVQKFKEEKWDEAEKAFETVLRTNDLHKQANFYLAHINSKQGEEDQVLKYVKAYHGLKESYVTSECIALAESSDLGLVPLMESANSGEISPEEFIFKLAELGESLGPEFAETCKLVSKSHAGNADFLTDE